MCFPASLITYTSEFGVCDGTVKLERVMQRQEWISMLLSVMFMPVFMSVLQV
jgi:putative effector of murein hydrolase LrgA (UPF0299 family)